MIQTDVEIPSLIIIVGAKIEDDKWVKTRLDQLILIDEKRRTAFCLSQLYQQTMAHTYNMKVCPRQFEVDKLILNHILPNQ